MCDCFFFFFLVGTCALQHTKPEELQYCEVQSSHPNQVLKIEEWRGRLMAAGMEGEWNGVEWREGQIWGETGQ